MDKGKNRSAMLLGFGIASFIAFQAAINMMVIAGLAPTKGMPAPFISYGGTSILFLMAEMGIVLSVSNGITLES